jgi:C-methyltransferase
MTRSEDHGYGRVSPSPSAERKGAPLEPNELVFSLTNAAVAARCLHVVAELGVADHIGDHPVPTKDLAQLCAVDLDGLDRVLRLLAAHGVFSGVSGGYQHSPASQLLRSDHPRSMRAFPQMMGLPVVLKSFDELAHSVRTGHPSIELSDPGGLWSYLSQAPAEQAVFGRAMTARAAGDTAAVLAAHDFSACGRIVDVGGGRGHLLHAVLESAPRARGILFDLPGVVEAGGAVHPRLVRQAGDFFVDPLPAGDTYLVMEVLHDWADAEATAILAAIRRAASDDAKVLIIEGILPEHLDPGSLTVDVIMLTVTGGRERTAGELEDLLDTAGLQLTRVIDTPGRLRIAEAIPVPAGRRHDRQPLFA